MSPPVTTPVRADLAEAGWAYALTKAEFGIAEISVGIKVSDRLAGRMIRAWKDEGRLIELPRTGIRQRGQWRVNPAWTPARTASPMTVEGCLWNAMRQLKSFTPRVLAGNAATPEVEVKPEAAQDYCRALLAAGYLSVTRKAVPGRTEAIYRLVRNTGPRPPRQKRVRALIDANTEQTIVISGVIGGGQ